MYDPTGNHPIVPYVSLCSGYEGIGLGLHRCIPNLRTVAYCEREIFGAANLCAKIEAGLLDPAPIFTDVCTFPWSEFAPFMAGGILSFGWPCQPVSHDGKRKATEDERWLFDIIADGIGVMRPGWLFAENVEGLLSARMPDGSSVFGHCITRLERLHYKVAAGIFSASEVGAPHQRKRVFILAYDQRQRIEELGRQIAVGSQQHSAWDDGGMGNASSQRHSGTAWSSSQCAQGQSLGHAAESNGRLWPSRPGEQQFWWEPPRVVVDAKSQRAGQRSELRGQECGSRSALPWDVEQSGEGALANDHRAHAGHGEQRPERTLGDLSGGCGEAMGNAASQRPGTLGAEPAGQQRQASIASTGDAMGDTAQRQDHGREPGDVGATPSQWRCGDHAADGAGEVLGNAAHTNRRSRVSAEEAGAGPEDIWRRRSGESGERQTQPPLGRDADGPADWLDDAELYVTCDNRTDELRLLGNGVVPQTCERAFRVLVGELMEHQP